MSEPASKSCKQIYILLENSHMAERIRSVLAEQGLNALVVQSNRLPSSGDARDLGLVVTYTAMIGLVRSRLDVPVINIETLIFNVPSHNGEPARKKFDGIGFISRIFAILSSERRLAA